MQDLWFIGLLPGKEVANKVDVHRQYAAEHFNSRHALKSFPHITLFPPFRLSESAVADLSMLLRQRMALYRSFNIELKDFGSFSPRAIFIDVTINPQLLQLQAALDYFLRQQMRLGGDKEDRQFTPHLTIAHRDLEKKMFRQGWEHFKNLEFSEEFTADSLEILLHDGKRWQVYQSLSFGTRPEL